LVLGQIRLPNVNQLQMARRITVYYGIVVVVVFVSWPLCRLLALGKRHCGDCDCEKGCAQSGSGGGDGGDGGGIYWRALWVGKIQKIRKIRQIRTGI